MLSLKRHFVCSIKMALQQVVFQLQQPMLQKGLYNLKQNERGRAKCGAFFAIFFLQLFDIQRHTVKFVTPVITCCLKCVIFCLTNRGPFKVSISQSLSFYFLLQSLLSYDFHVQCFALALRCGQRSLTVKQVDKKC